MSGQLLSSQAVVLTRSGDIDEVLSQADMAQSRRSSPVGDKAGAPISAAG